MVGDEGSGYWIGREAVARSCARWPMGSRSGDSAWTAEILATSTSP
jgi:N-acetylglucosamine kinase-like BadF-type ATPase